MNTRNFINSDLIRRSMKVVDATSPPWADRLDVRAKHRLALSRKPRAVLAIQRFRDAVKIEGEKWIVIDGSVYDVGSLFDKCPHPGGDFVGDFIGLDASLWFYTTHMKSPNVWASLRPHWVGYLEETDNDKLASRADRELMELIDEAAEKGYFTYPISHVVAQISACMVLTVIQFYLAALAFLPPSSAASVKFEEEAIQYHWLFLSVVAGIVAKLIAIWFVHDVGHLSVFKTKKQNYRLLKYAGLLMLNGIPNATMETHNYHHCFVNVIGRDSTWAISIFKFHPDQVDAEGLPFGYSLWAPILWHALLWLYATVEYLTSWNYCVQEKEYLLLFLMIARKVATFGVPMMLGCSWEFGASYFFAIHAASFILGFLSTLNHLAEIKETIAEFKEKTRERSYVYHQAGKTCNGPVTSDPGVLHQAASWAIGHLNYHVEHHMIPYMPRHNLPRIAKRIRRICELDEASRNGARQVYRAEGYAETIPRMIRTLASNPVEWFRANAR